MKKIIALAKQYSNKMLYFEEDGKYKKVLTDSKEKPIPFVNKKQMYKDWGNVEELKIFNPTIKVIIR